MNFVHCLKNNENSTVDIHVCCAFFFVGGLMIHSILLYLHIASVIVSIGPFFILIPLIRKLKKATDQELTLYIPTFKFSVQLSKHSGHILVISGVLLLWLDHLSWLTSWVVITIFIMASSLFFIARAFSPALKQLLDPASDRNLVVNKLRANLWLYIVLMFLMLWFMVTKPNYWYI